MIGMKLQTTGRQRNNERKSLSCRFLYNSAKKTRLARPKLLPNEKTKSDEPLNEKCYVCDKLPEPSGYVRSNERHVLLKPSGNKKRKLRRDGSEKNCSANAKKNEILKQNASVLCANSSVYDESSRIPHRNGEMEGDGAEHTKPNKTSSSKQFTNFLLKVMSFA